MHLLKQLWNPSVRKFIIIIFVILLLPVIIVAFLNHDNPLSNLLKKSNTTLTEKQKKEALKEILGRSPKEEKNVQSGALDSLEYSGKYFSLTYPSSVTVYNRENKNVRDNKSILEFFRLDQNEPNLSFIAQVIEGSNFQNLDEYPAVALRKNQKKNYVESEIEIDSTKGVSFIGKPAYGKTDKVSFILKNNKIFSFSISATNLSEVEEIYNRILSTVKIH